MQSLQDSGTGNGDSKKSRTDEPKVVAASKVDAAQRDELMQLYKLQMPEDLYHFWDFCMELCPDNPRGILSFYNDTDEADGASDVKSVLLYIDTDLTGWSRWV